MTTSKSPHLDPVWLRQKYIDEGLSTYDIGKLVNRDPKRIYEKLRNFGIPTRPRGLNLKGDDCYMKHPDNVNPFHGKHHSDETRARLSETASHPKPYLRGERNGMHAKTGSANPNYRDGSSPDRQRLYASGEWKAIMRAVYLRDGYKCVRCGSPKMARRGLHAHHICAWAGHPELRFDLSNLVTLCKSCHEWVHSNANVNREFIG